MNLKLLLVFTLPAVLAIGCGDDDDPVDPGPGNIVQVATDAGLTQLVETATIAGLDDTLRTGGPFTVFAPTNDAFDALGSAAPTDPGLLANILLNHVVSGRQSSSDVLAAQSLDTLANTTLEVDASTSTVTVAGAPLSSTLDVAASNGTVHVIDAVIVPPSIGEVTADVADLSILDMAVSAASATVGATLTGTSAITVFAPVNSAFDGIDLNAIDRSTLDDILTYHVVVGQTLSSDLSDAQEITMANGDTLRVNVSTSAITLTDGMNNTVTVTDPDIRLLNGTVHLVDAVLMPPL